jgi:hypothetical protein
MLAWLAGCGTDPAIVPVPAPEPRAAPAPTAPPPEAPIVGLALGETTVCVRRADDRVSCRGGQRLASTALVGTLSVTDGAVCAREPGRVRCVRDGHHDEDETALVAVGFGAGGVGCGRDAVGGVWCFPGYDETDAPLHPVALPRPAVALVASRLAWVLLDDGALRSFDPYGVTVGTGASQVVAQRVTALDGTALEVCWRIGEGITCEGEGGRGAVRDVGPSTGLSVGLFGGCVLSGGVPWCWDRERIARPVAGVDRLVAIASGSFRTCGLRDDGALSCWTTVDGVRLSDPFAP